MPKRLSIAEHHRSGSCLSQHVVLVVQESWSFLNLFATFPGAHGAKYWFGKDGRVVPRSKKLRAGNLYLPTDITYCSAAFKIAAIYSKKMDGFNDERKACLPATRYDPRNSPKRR